MRYFFNIFILGFFLFSESLYAETLQSSIVRVSGNIVNNKVEIELINEYIAILKNKKEEELQIINLNKRKFFTAVSNIYKIQIIPKETLLIQNLDYSQIAYTYLAIDYWVKSYINIISSFYETLKHIEDNERKLNLIKQKLIILNASLEDNKEKLKQILDKNNIDEETINQINNLRQNINYLVQKSKQNDLNIYTNDNYLPSKELNKDKTFIKKNKGKMDYPSSGYIYKTYKNNNYYDLTYNGIILIGTENSNILAPAKGVVIYVGKIKTFKNIIIIKHSPSINSIIAGDFETNIKKMQLVNSSDVIANVKKNAQPIYFELQYKNNSVNPLDWLKEK